MAAMPAPLDDDDPINILLRPFDPLNNGGAALSLALGDAAADAQALADAQASQAARDAAAAAAEEAERQKRLAEEKANLLRQQTFGGKGNATSFGGADGEVLYESNVRPSARGWQSKNRVDVKRTVCDFKMAEPLPPGEYADEETSMPSVLSPAVEVVSSSTTHFSQPIKVELVSAVQAAPVAHAAVRVRTPSPSLRVRTPSPGGAAPGGAAPVVVTRKAAPSPRASPKPPSGPGRRAVPLEGAPSVFSPTAGVHPTQAGDAGAPNKTEELFKKVGGGHKVRQCPSFRMLEFQIQYDEYKQTKTAVS